jgi:hypothetical protein
MEKQEREICRGHWLYGGVQPKGVIVMALNYDYYHEEEKAAGFFDLAGETPVLNEQGEMYFIAWTDASFTEQESYTTGLLDLAETLALACSISGQPIQWLTPS